MNFSKMMKNVKVMDKIIDGKDFKLLEKQDDDMLLSIGKHILIHHFSDIKEYHKKVYVGYWSTKLMKFISSELLTELGVTAAELDERTRKNMLSSVTISDMLSAVSEDIQLV